MKKVNLKKLIYQNYLKTALVSILFIELALLLLYFYVTNNVVNKSSNLVIKDVQYSVYSKIDNLKNNINKDFLNIEKTLRVLQIEHQNFFKFYKSINIQNKPKFEKAYNNMFYKSLDNGGSSVVVSKNTLINKGVKEQLEKTEVFDDSFKSIVNDNDLIIAAYFNSQYDYSRYYPYIPNSYEAFPTDIKMSNYNFYYDADINHNPEKKVVWTDVYLDPAGQGWMISAIAPIYYKNTLEGVTGLDITIDKIINTLLNEKLPYEGDSFLIDKTGEIIATTDNINKILKIKNKKYNYKKDEKISKTILKDENNILNHKNKKLVEVLSNAVSNLKYKHEVTIDGKKYLIFTKYIEKTSWYIISLIQEEKVLTDVNKLEEYYKSLGFLTISLIVIFYILFFIFLYNKARDFVKKINTPLLKIIELTRNIGTKQKVDKLVTTGIEELDLLNDNFNKMVTQLDERTAKLIETEAQRAMHEHLCNIDALTGAFNRRYLNDFCDKYFDIVKREKTTFSILIIDVDDFKKINDNYGHNIGDMILKLLVERLKYILRDNDIIVRFGGDEFIILLPDTDLKNSKIVGNKILTGINSIKDELDKEIEEFTISIGCAEFNKKDNNIEDMIIRADDSLYYAKKIGKNTVI